MFDNEDEKEQWEEDQKVSGAVILNICLMDTRVFWWKVFLFFF